MDENKYQQFLDYIKSEREELREDLIGMPIIASKKVGDFGCGWGYITWCLMHEIPTSECIGIDKFDPDDPPTFSDGFSRENVQNWYKEIDAEKYPDFQQHDIVKDENIPSDFDLIYCKRVFYNIFINNNGDAKVKQAINHIARALKSSGWFCLVEIQESQFKSILEESLIQTNFEFSPPRCLFRPYKTLLKTYNEYPYLIYQCKQVKY